MVGRRNEKLNRLQRLLPEGLLVDTTWLDAHGYRRQWREKYVAHGWLEGVTRGVYQRPGPSTDVALAWQRVVISLQRLLGVQVHVGGRTALELVGRSHYVPLQGPRDVHLYAAAPLPSWVFRVPADARFVAHRRSKLFGPDMPQISAWVWGHWGWTLDVSSEERALCELLDQVPERETFHQADVLMESASTLSPRRVQTLLEACQSVKVKRLFLWFAERHQHAWFARLDVSRIDLGRGKRQLVAGGRYDTKYQITVPDPLDAHF
jgi:Transcriptional regulator, AbiEi antitoxin, Type IV TA system/Transcriptional regulator, AbiEi antitoxin N-terminal domain